MIISHNKTLAAQLYERVQRTLSANNAVEYFVSYYDYYQPEAYIPQRDIYIEKDCLHQRRDRSIASGIERLAVLLSRRDVIVVAIGQSCIYGLGSPKDYLRRMMVAAEGGG